MKKLLNLLGSFAVISAPATSIVAGEKNEKKDLKDLADSFTITSLKTAKDFKEKLIAKIKKEPGFKNIIDTEIEILKKDSTVLDDAYINGTMIEVKIKSKINAKKTFGEKDIKVTWSMTAVAENDFSNLTVPIDFIPAGNNIDEFRDILVSAIKAVNADNIFATLDNNDFELRTGWSSISSDNESESGLHLSHDHVTTASKTTGKIWVTMKSRKGSKFVGKKTFEINLKADFKYLKVPIGVVPPGNDITEFKDALTIAIRKANDGSVFSKLESFDFELKNSAGDAVLTHTDVTTASKATEKKSKLQLWHQQQVQNI